MNKEEARKKFKELINSKIDAERAATIVSVMYVNSRLDSAKKNEK